MDAENLINTLDEVNVERAVEPDLLVRLEYISITKAYLGALSNSPHNKVLETSQPKGWPFGQPFGMSKSSYFPITHVRRWPNLGP